MLALGYAFGEAYDSLWRGGRSTLLSVITISAALLVTGLFLLITTNLDRLVASWGSAAELSVYLRDEVTEAERTAIDQRIRTSPVVLQVELVSKEQALARFKRDFSDLASIAAALGDNPFPASYDVRLNADRAASAQIDTLAERIAELPGVTDVRYDRRWIERLMMAGALVRGIGSAFAFLLIMAASLSVANVVRLSCHARRSELEIMHLVGAPMSFVRGPFIAEGVLQGGLGAMVAVAGLWAAFLLARMQYGHLTSGLGTEAFTFLAPRWVVALVAGGIIVGCIGGLVGARSARTSPSAAAGEKRSARDGEVD